MHELLFPNPLLPALGWTWDRDAHKKLVAEANARITGPLYNLSFVLLAIVAVLGGRFSRGGYAGRIAIVAGIAAFVRILGVMVETASNDMGFANILQYAVPLIPIVICLRLIMKHDEVRKLGKTKSFTGLTPIGGEAA